ncbi:hypothetical protein AB0127_27700, partial [Klebsiella pneumoniae]
LDWQLTYYRSNVSNFYPAGGYDNMLYTNLYQGTISYTFDETRRVSLTLGYRADRGVLKSVDPSSLITPDTLNKYLVGRIEYVYDNTVNPTQN